jgi:hypothetical protein
MPKTADIPHVAPPEAGPVIATLLAQTDPNVAFE